MKYLLAVMLLTGCGKGSISWESRRTEIRTDAFKVAVDNCLAEKGIPIYSQWDGSLQECRRSDAAILAVLVSTSARKP